MDSPQRDTGIKSLLSKRSSRTVGTVALLALLPAVAFAFTKSLLAGAVTSVNVVLIFGCIYVLLSPTEDESHDPADHADTTV